MTIFKKELSQEGLEHLICKLPTLAEHLGLEFFELTENSLSIRMPVDHRTKQIHGILHGGASAALAETVGSIASFLTLSDEGQTSVGIELNISHLKATSEGFIIGTATPVRLGRTIQVWEIKNVHENGDLISVARLTVMVRKHS